MTRCPVPLPHQYANHRTTISYRSAPSCETSSIIQLDQSPPPRKKLSSLSEWSIERIKAVFEGSNSANNSGDEDDNDNEGSESKVRAAISATFADTVVVTANGSPLPREDIDLLVLAMRRSSVDPTTGLNVEWKRAEDIPRDPQTNRVNNPSPPPQKKMIILFCFGKFTPFF